MREELIREKSLLDFYKKMVALSQKDLHSSEVFLEQAFTAMMMGHEFGNDRLCQRKSYEILLMWNLSYNLYVNKKDDISFVDKLEDVSYPFSSIDEDGYYRRLVTDDPLLLRELFFNCRLADDLERERKRNTSIALMLLNLKNSSCVESFKSFSKLKNILRTGWTRRKVREDYLESDATHTMQMIAMASAYFTIFKPTDLDYNKVMDMIIIHEIGEVLAGDIPEGDPLHNDKHALEARGVRNAFSGLASGEYFINLWEEFESRESNEAKFVYELDKFDPIVKAEYLDEELDRSDLFLDFYGYEEKRGTFKEGKLKKVFKCLGEKK
ncbi:MAG: HD domain-containing protein [Bacilli bacterium]|nr:HD domain-containing protein [Bacilli bacterium]